MSIRKSSKINRKYIAGLFIYDNSNKEHIMLFHHISLILFRNLIILHFNHTIFLQIIFKWNSFFIFI
jgi:hypothetical protein